MKIFLKYFLLLSFFALLLPTSASSAPLHNCNDPEINTYPLVADCCVSLPGKFYKVENCVSNVFRVAAGDTKIINLTNQIRPVFSIVGAFAVLILGMKIATGSLGKKTYSESIMLLIKITFVTGFIFSSMFIPYVRALTGFGEELALIVTQAIFPGTTSIWEQFDMIFDAAMGFMAGGAIIIGLIIVALFFVSGPGGLLALGAVVAMIGGFFVVFATAIYAAFLAKFAIYFLMAFGPLFAPLVIFNPQTFPRNLFERWIELIIKYTLHLVILYAYLALMGLLLAGTVGVGTFASNPNTLNYMITHSSITACTIVDLIFVKFQVACIDWDAAKTSRFFQTVLLVVILIYTSWSFFQYLPKLINKLVGDLSNVSFSGDAMRAANALRSTVSAKGIVSGAKAAPGKAGQALAAARAAPGKAREAAQNVRDKFSSVKDKLFGGGK